MTEFDTVWIIRNQENEHLNDMIALMKKSLTKLTLATTYSHTSDSKYNHLFTEHTFPKVNVLTIKSKKPLLFQKLKECFPAVSCLSIQDIYLNSDERNDWVTMFSMNFTSLKLTRVNLENEDDEADKLNQILQKSIVTNIHAIFLEDQSIKQLNRLMEGKGCSEDLQNFLINLLKEMDKNINSNFNWGEKIREYLCVNDSSFQPKKAIDIKSFVLSLPKMLEELKWDVSMGDYNLIQRKKNGDAILQFFADHLHNLKTLDISGFQFSDDGYPYLLKLLDQNKNLDTVNVNNLNQLTMKSAQYKGILSTILKPGYAIILNNDFKRGRIDLDDAFFKWLSEFTKDFDEKPILQIGNTKKKTLEQIKKEHPSLDWLG